MLKFHANRMLFSIQSINYFLCIILDYKNSKFKYLIDDIAIDLLSSWNVASMGDLNGGFVKIQILSKI